jgi:hypothetical protein
MSCPDLERLSLEQKLMGFKSKEGGGRLCDVQIQKIFLFMVHPIRPDLSTGAELPSQDDVK